MRNPPLQRNVVRDALVFSLRVDFGGVVAPLQAELRGGLVLMRFAFPPDVTLDAVVREGVREELSAVLAANDGALGVHSTPDAEVVVGGVTLRGRRVTIGAARDGRQLITVRYRDCVGDALSLFQPGVLPEIALASRDADTPDVDVLRDVLMPLFNLRQYLSDHQSGEYARDLGELAALLKELERRIGAIEDRYFTALSDVRGDGEAEAVEGPGVVAALEALRADERAASGKRRRSRS